MPDISHPANASVPIADHPEFAASPDDIIRASYRLFLNREAENETVVSERRHLTVDELVSSFVSSQEFAHTVIDTALGGDIPSRWAADIADAHAQALIRALGGSLGAEAVHGDWVDSVASWLTPFVLGQIEKAHGASRADALARAISGLQQNSHSEHNLSKLTRTEFQARSTGVIVEDINDILWNRYGEVFTSTSTDPWLRLRPSTPVTGPSTIAILTVHLHAAGTSDMQLYIDTGSGFNEAESIILSTADRNEVHFAVEIGPERLPLRLDPANRSGDVAIREVNLRTIIDKSELIPYYIRNKNKEIEADYRDKIFYTTIDKLFNHDENLKNINSNLKKLSKIISSDNIELPIDYSDWVNLLISNNNNNYRTVESVIRSMKIKPSFSFVVPTYNTPIELLQKCVESMLSQTYPLFEICIADDNSRSPEVIEYLTRISHETDRIKLERRRTNGHISEASNTAAALATGDFLVLVDHDDEVPDYALLMVAYYVNMYPLSQVIFSDEDKITKSGERFDPYFKSAFNETLMYGHNMVSHLGVYKRELFNAVGGFRRGFEGAQDYDLLLRCLEKCGRDAITHIPHVLYHWRAIPGSTALSSDQKNYAIVAAQAALNEHFTRTGRPFRSVDTFAPGISGVEIVSPPDTRLSIIIPTRDRIDLLRPCIESICENIDRNIEIIIADNGSAEAETFDYFETITRMNDVRIVHIDGPFNFSRINNIAAASATGDIICFLNNDTEVVSPQWISRARGLLSQSDIGAVGARLLFPDGTLQHFGIVLGLGPHRIAGHPFAGQNASDPGYFAKARLMAEFSAVTAACLFVRKRDFEAVGGFDTDLRVAYNDVDFCLKLRAAGLKIICDPDIVLVHKESQSRGSDVGESELERERTKRLDAEAELMRKKWGDLLLDDPYYSPNLSLDSNRLHLACPPRIFLPFSDARPDGE